MSGRPDISQYGRTVYSVVYVAVNRCAIIIQIMCYAVKGVKISHYIQNFKRQNSTNAEKFLYLLGHLMKKNQRHKNLCQHSTNYLSKNSAQVGQNFQNQLPDNLSGISTYHFQSTWSEVHNPTSAQVGQKLKITSTQLAPKWRMPLRHRLCRS